MTSGAEFQVENGNWLRVHNGIFERLAKLRVTGREASCLFFLFRMTYGYQTKEKPISLSLWAEGTDIDKRHVKAVVDGLVERRIIYRVEGKRGRGNTAIYGFNKYFEQWDNGEKVPPTVPIKKVPSTAPFIEPDADEKVPSTVPEKVPSTVPIKERKKGEAAAADSLPPRPEHYADFVADYQHAWGMVESPIIGDEIADWATRITRPGWQYALKEAVDSGKQRQWKYLRSILRRIEHEGYVAPAQAPTAPVIDFTMEELYGHR